MLRKIEETRYSAKVREGRERAEKGLKRELLETIIGQRVETQKVINNIKNA